MFNQPKPFGQQPAFSGFGSPQTTATPFGQIGTTFAKPATGFSAPAFGTATGTSLFGQNAQPATTGLFGAANKGTAFGQQPAQTGFGFQSTATPGLFGAQQPQQAAAPATGGLFGASTSSAFGQAKPAFGFGARAPTTAPTLFGQPQTQQSQTTSVFGNTATQSTNMFSSLSGGFGGTTPQGTTIKYKPTAGTDSILKHGHSQTVSTQHCCISTMKEYENKSLEELRYEDYLAGRKGPQKTGGVFGAAQTTASPFGAPSTSTAPGGLFGSTTENKSLFGQPSTSIGGFGAPSTGFGTAAQTGTLFGKPTTGFGTATTSTTGFGFGNTTTPANPFGANTQAKPFGVAAPQTTNLFGAPASQPSTGFGITPTTGFGSFASQPNQNIGLFNQNKPTFTLGSNNSAFNFGQNTSTTTGTTLFGAKTTAPSFGAPTGFGAPATGTTAFSNSFGAPSTTQSTSLFTGTGFNKPASGFSFGPTPATSSTGLGLNLGQSSLFGNNAQKPGGLFSGGSTFGAPTLGTNTGFGGGTSLGTGLNLGGNTSLGAGSGLGGAPASQSSQLAQQQLLAMALVPFGDSPLFRNLLPSTGRANEILQPTNPAAQKAVLNASAQYKVSPKGGPKIKVKVGYPTLVKKSLCEGLEEDDVSTNQTFQVRPNPKRLNINPAASANRSTTESVSASASVSRPSGTQESEKENLSPLSPISQTATESGTADWLRKSRDVSKPSTSNYGRHSLNESAPSHDDSVTNNTIHEFRMQQSSPASHKEKEDQSISVVCVPSSSPRSEDRDANNSNKSSSSSDDSHDLEDSSPQLLDAESHPTGIICRRVGYYTIPSLDELTSFMSDDGSCIVDNFTVGRDGYGNVFFEDKFDVADLNLDEIVHFRHKEVVIYPDDQSKPPVGQGLNRHAQVTLDRVWPMDKTTHNPIMDPDRLSQMDYEGKLRRVCARMDARFKEYRPQTGSWVFTVDHFSKYGLTDSDEEDVPPATLPKAGVVKAVPGKGVPPKQSPIKTTPAQGAVDLKKLATGFDTEMLDTSHSQMAKKFASGYEAETVTHITSPMGHLARESGTSARKVQLMKATFCMGGDEDDDVDMCSYLDPPALPFSGLGGVGDGTEYSDGSEEEIARSAPVLSRHGLLRTHFALSEISGQRIDVSPAVSTLEASSSFQPRRSVGLIPAVQNVQLPVIVDKPKTVVLQCKGKIDRSMISGRCLADMALMRGASFKVGWGLDSRLFCLDDGFEILSASFRGHSLSIKMLTTEKPSVFQDSIEGHLKIQLMYSLSGMQGGCPIRAPASGTGALLKHQREAQKIADCDDDVLLNYHHEVWELCSALWGDLPELEIEEGTKDLNTHYTTMVRRKAVSKWLETVSKPLVEMETNRVFKSDAAQYPLKEEYLDGILSLLSGRQILEACQKAQDYGDHYLAQLLSQLSGSTAVRKFMCEQLDSWEKSKADAFIDPRRLRLYLLVAGLAHYETSEGSLVNTCYMLDWKRAFATHLWYICSPVASLADALKLYQEAFSASDEDNDNAYAKRPDPPYLDAMSDDCIVTVHGRKLNDLCYHLLQLYCERSHPLEQLLNPATHTDDPQDYRLSWCLMQVLHSIDYAHLSPLSEAIIHSGFASQLENNGLWHWAIFVLLHLKDDFARKSSVLDMLGRHVELLEMRKLSEAEEFLHKKLQIPLEWIYQAKAVRAACMHRYQDQVWYLLKASDWNEAHQVIMEHLAADAIINEHYVYLESLLKELEPVERSSTISGWSNQGALLWDYLTVHQTVNDLLDLVASNPDGFRDNDASYKLEKIQPQLSRLCSKINNLPCRNAKDRLCQCEIAKRACTLVRNVTQLQRGESAVWSTTLSHLIAQLPLPEDYTQQELLQLLNAYMT
ncbi:Nuclear pore complex protein Nup98-Nup96 [Frankliniella fusca]|uniref:Nuclear pore complex protein Nup98-Nup96 n=1 Tax=Frankliniella fusca TaxID=407009 RepID=A0AAE1GW14_9NEOP|nr:Nuclear pore complex protein Nup98-Nup96 [Frankliniella fusca]